MKCFTVDCENEGTMVDPESPAIFINPENPSGAKVVPVKCPEHYAEMMRRRDENEASFDRMLRSIGRR